MIYKVFRIEEWRTLEEHGQTLGSAADIRDGFIHFSTMEQLVETMRRHFAEERELLLAAIDEALLGEELRWEEARGGQRFPHLYRALRLEEVVWCRPVAFDEEGRPLIEALV